MADTTDTLIRFLLPEAHTRGAIIKASNIVKIGAETHGLSGMPGDIFGKSLIASILLLSVSKGGIRQVLQLDATADSHAPVRRMLAEARAGSVRGYIVWQEERASIRNEQETGISAWMGHPMRLSTVRDLGIGQPYVSTIEHDSEFLAD
ncbi:MAG: Hsp33 family molecular chaperone HslO, partial [Mariprofundaceae bacterium]